MLIELRVTTDGDRHADVAVEMERSMEVGSLADALAAHLGEPAGRSIRVASGGRVLDRDLPVGASGLRRGEVVQLVAPSPCVERRADRAPAALVVVDGPDRGRRHVLRSGTSSIGRGADCTLRLSDPSVSRHHADVSVGWSVELADRGSAHGTEVDGRAIDGPTRIEAGALIRVGETVLALSLDDAATAEQLGDDLHFNRPPRLVRRDEARRFAFPPPPARQRGLRFPWMSLVAAVCMGLAFMGLGGGGWRTGIFYLFMPVLLIAGALESRSGARADHAQDVREWRRAVVAKLDELCAAQAEELAVALHSHPSDDDLLTLVDVLGARLWEREPGHPDFLALRCGVGAVSSHHTIELPEGGPSGMRDELVDQLAPYGDLDGSPIEVHLGEVGNLGLAGDCQAVASLARSAVLQVASLHSPAHVGIAAAVEDDASWDWLKWLPHRRTAAVLLGGSPTGTDPSSAADLISRIEALVRSRTAERSDEGAQPGRSPSLVVLHDASLGIDRARIDDLLRDGPPVGVHVVWLDESFARLPSRLGATVVATHDAGEVDIAWTRAGRSQRVQAASARLDAVERAALRLSPLVDGGVRLGISAELAAEVRAPQVLGPLESWSDAAGVVERWRSAAPGRLRASVGALADGHPLVVDLRRDGPHALVAGTTGAGKSELLQSLVCGLALDLPPARVNFLLVDYKGGAAFRECADLPHTVGLVTDLDAAEVRRALVSLDAELRRREEILAAARVKDLPTLERLAPTEAPPALVIVVDEFAALSREVPEFVDGVVDIAQRGRSLGLHLVLATQRPAGVVTETIRANTNLRVALRMADATESLDVIDSALAASLPVRTPGRAVLRVGGSDLRVFQGVHLGARSDDGGRSVTVRSFGLNGAGDGGTTTLGDTWSSNGADAATDLARIVEACRAAADREALAPPFRPWKDPLPTVVDLRSLPPAERCASLPVALRDDPAAQEQAPLAIDLARDGHLAVFGTSGAGKTVLLRTLAAAAAARASDEPVRIDAIDAAGRGLAVLERLPEVGSVLDADRELERVLRLLRTLTRELDDRTALLASEGVDDIDRLHERLGDARLPRRLLLIDGLPAFHDRYERLQRGLALDLLGTILAEGRRVGLHVAMASEQRSGLFSPLLTSVQRRIVMRQASADDEASLGVQPGTLGPDAPAGRALIDGSTCQIAILGGSTDPELQHEALDQLAAATAGRDPAPAVPVLPATVLRRELRDRSTADRLVLGVAEDDLGPAVLELDGEHLCVFGPPRSGKTTALRLLAEEIRATATDRALRCIAARKDDALGGFAWDEVALGPAAGVELVERLCDDLELGSTGPTTLVIDDVVDLLDDGLEGPLEALLRRGIGHDLQVIASGDAGRATTWSEALKRLRGSRGGLLLQPDHDRDGDLLAVTLPMAPPVDAAPGRGYVVTRRTQPAFVQLCLPAGLAAPEAA